jgi:hypothetical protein
VYEPVVSLRSALWTGGRVVAAGCVARERKNAVGRVTATYNVAKEHTGTVGRVRTAACVEEERFKTGGRVVVPVVRLKSASSPSAVF